MLKYNIPKEYYTLVKRFKTGQASVCPVFYIKQLIKNLIMKVCLV